MKVFEETTWSRREELEAAQLAALRELLSSAAASPFWRKRFAASDWSADTPLTLPSWRRLPLLEKEDLAADQRAHPPYGSNLTRALEPDQPAEPDKEGSQGTFLRLHQTSSTTGTPLRWLDTAEDWAWMRSGWRSVLEAAGVTPRDRALFAFSFGPFIGFWLGFEAAQELGCLTLPGGALDSRGRLELMRTHRISVLGCTPTYALRLGEVAREHGFEAADLPVRALIVAGEPGGCVPAVRRRLGELWPAAQVFDHYGMTEVGPVSYQRVGRPDEVVLNEAHYLCEFLEPGTDEVLEPDGERLAELVLTPLGRTGMPVLRYRTGDLVRPAVLPTDGSFQTLIGGIQTRASQMVVVRGVNLYPSAFEQILRELGGIAEYQIDIDRGASMTEARLRVELAPGVAKDHLGRIQEALRHAFHLRIPVSEASEPLPRFELKARRWNVRD